MLNRTVKLSANGSIQVRGDIKRVIVRRSTSGFLMETDKNERVEAAQGDNFLFEKVSGVLTLTDLSGSENHIELILVASNEGDVSSAASAVDVANVAEMAKGLAAAAGSCEINTYAASAEGVMILSGLVENRRTAIVSTSGAIQVATSQGGNRFTVDGVLDHPASGELWAFGDSEILIEVMEYLN
ncbi:hypothetical protein [Oceanobacter sp. 3_MG-2023]|uniref:hypothetical protein n=1 Tax=Oceanobacter sp. 3_MG-2023 TaxID=3062622 RepID=UPI00273397BA|nr:hypothetical protein [Oceanobacter sp. 3_MG-2023]MDP2505643.1 hypothetical protein [Oceanobacter sp. 3_MG-2023]